MSSIDSPPRRLDLRAAFSEGLSLAASRNGLVFVAAYVALEAVTVLLAIAGGVYLPLDQAAGVGGPPGLPVGRELPAVELFGASALTSGFALVVSIPLTIIAIRTFVVGATDRIPEASLSHRLGRATLSAVFAFVLVVFALGVLFGLGVGGLALLDSVHTPLGPLAIAIALVAIGGGVAAGFFGVVVHVFFVNHEIAVRDRGLRDALAGSWALASGERARVFVLAVLFVGVSVLVRPDGRPAAGGGLEPLAAALLLVRTVLYAVLWVALTAVVARAYRHLVPEDAVGAGR